MKFKKKKILMQDMGNSELQKINIKNWHDI